MVLCRLARAIWPVHRVARCCSLTCSGASESRPRGGEPHGLPTAACWPGVCSL